MDWKDLLKRRESCRVYRDQPVPRTVLDLSLIHIYFGAGGELVADKAAGSDPFAVALGNDLFILHIEELILHRGAARVDDKNLHGSLEPPLTFCTVREKNAAKRRYFLTGIFLSSIILYNFQKFKWK